MLSRLRILPADVSNQVLKPIQFQLINLFELLSQRALWKAFGFVPNHVMFGQINQVSAFVFAERHFSVREFDQLLALIRFHDLFFDNLFDRRSIFGNNPCKINTRWEN